MGPNPTMGVVLQMVRQNHEQAEEGHKRLRGDYREMEVDIGALKAQVAAIEGRVTRIEATPVNVEKVFFSGKMLTAIVGSAIVFAGGFWQLHVSIDNVHDAVINTAKLQDERNETQKEAIRELRAALEMRRVEIQNLSNLVQGKNKPEGSR